MTVAPSSGSLRCLIAVCDRAPLVQYVKVVVLVTVEVDLSLDRRVPAVAGMLVDPKSDHPAKLPITSVARSEYHVGSRAAGPLGSFEQVQVGIPRTQFRRKPALQLKDVPCRSGAPCPPRRTRWRCDLTTYLCEWPGTDCSRRRVCACPRRRWSPVWCWTACPSQ
jgi:hypothetical protein